MACRRNVFVMLQNTAPERAIAYLASVASQIPTFDEHVQLAVIELIRKEARAHVLERPKYLKLLHALLNSPEHCVKYEAAMALTSLTSHPDAIKASIACYIELLRKEADNNVKLIVLDRVLELIERGGTDRLGDELVVDLLRVLSAPDMEVRRKCCTVALAMTTIRSVENVVGVLKRELAKSHEPQVEKASEYRQLLIQTIHTCAIQFPTVAATVVYILMDYLGDSSNASAVDVVAFVREVVERFPDLRSDILQRLCSALLDLKSGKVARGVLWILGEYGPSDHVSMIMESIQRSLGEVIRPGATDPTNPEVGSIIRATSPPGGRAVSPSSPVQGAAAPLKIQTNRVLPDGTYATQAALTVSSPTGLEGKRRPPLQALLQNGDYFTGAVLATALTKLSLRVRSESNDITLANRIAAESMFIMSAILQLGLSATMDEDSTDRIAQSLYTLTYSSETPLVQKVYLEECQKAFARTLNAQQSKQARSMAKRSVGANVISTVENPVTFGLLRRPGSDMSSEELDDYDRDLTRATGHDGLHDPSLGNKLDRVVPLTGFADPVYAEAYVTVNQFDILLDVLLVNQTTTTMQNLSLEFATLGDLKLVERPQPITMAPKSYHTLKANIKVASTETGVIFGNIVYDVGALDTRCVILNDIHIDIMDYIHPAQCTETQFRAMWTEFEWENKVNVVAGQESNTADLPLRAYLDQVLAATNMACLTPETAFVEDCGVLAANLYAKSVFGEDALANLCIERSTGGGIVGHIRIRSKAQGIALSLGDKITLAQKNAVNAAAAITA
jgi:coatomer subunit beta